MAQRRKNPQQPLLEKIRAQLPSEDILFSLVVRGRVVEGKSSEFAALAHRTEQATQREQGNFYYWYFVQAKDPRAYVLIEVWQNFAALVAHFETAHFKHFIEESRSLRERTPDIEVLLGVGDA